MKLNEKQIEKLIVKFGKDWYEVLKDILHTSMFLNTADAVQKERKNYTVYPESKNVFRTFRETGIYQTKVVFVGMDPYHDGTANGLSFCCRDSDKINPSLRIILKEIDDEFPENKDKIDFGRLDKQDLSRWAKQGVLMLNASLTVRAKQAGSHQKIWETFTKELFKTISVENHDIIFLLLGKQAQGYKDFIHENSPIFIAPHPAAELYKPGVGFLGSNIFKEINEHLSNTNRKEIEW